MRKVFCPYCGSVTQAGTRCPCQKRKRRPTDGDRTRGTREPWRHNYSASEYRRARQGVIERQNGRCKDCGIICAEKIDGKWRTKDLGGEVDHEIPLCHNGSNNVSNLALRCKRCHGLADAKRRRLAKRNKTQE